MYDFEEKISKFRVLSGSTLKIIACISMFIDHATLILWHGYRDYISTLDYDSIMFFKHIYDTGRAIGRAAFPIFCFLLVEGFFHTRNVYRYFVRLLVMALVSEHAFNLLASDMPRYPEDQNVYFTLLISLLVMICIDTAKRFLADKPGILTFVMIAICSLGCLAAYLLKTDYSFKGVIAVTVMYLLHGSRIMTCLGTALSFIWEPWALTAVAPILLYNNKRGLKLKYFFYLFYPLHIYLIYFVVNYVLPREF